MNLYPAINYETLYKLKIQKLIPYIKQKQNLNKPLDLHLLESLTNIDKTTIERTYNIIEYNFKEIEKAYPEVKIQYLENNLIPYFMYQGNLNLLKTNCITIAGTRKPSPWGRLESERITSYLGKKGYTIITGLAKGIDTLANKKALEEGLNTIAVIATPINKYYPAENRKIQNQISKEGLLITPFAPNTNTRKWHFLLRNKVMVNFSLASIVIEAFDGGGSTQLANYTNSKEKPVFTSNFFYKNNVTTWQKKICKIYTYSDYGEVDKAIKNPYFRKSIEKRFQRELF